jgi:hypothetical protein
VERVRQTLVSADPDFRTYGVRRLSDSLDASFWQARFELWVLGILGALALVLAAVGMYGVLTYHVTARAREIGIRVALGARPREVIQLVIRAGSPLLRKLATCRWMYRNCWCRWRCCGPSLLFWFNCMEYPICRRHRATVVSLTG